jgi:thiol-disulfide isomerase/thioredoxin
VGGAGPTEVKRLGLASSVARPALAALVSLASACQSPPTASVVKEAPSAPVATASGSAGVVEPVSPSGPKESGVRMILAPADADALSVVRTERLRARSEGRVLAVYVGATWCEPCKRFKHEIEAGRLDAQLGKVTLLAFDADRDQDRLGALGYTFKFIPYVGLPGADGRPTDSQEAKGKGSMAWREVASKLEAWQTPAR